MKEFKFNFTVFKNYDERICEGDVVTRGTVTLEAEDNEQALNYAWTTFFGWSHMKYKVVFERGE